MAVAGDVIPVVLYEKSAHAAQDKSAAEYSLTISHLQNLQRMDMSTVLVQQTLPILPAQYCTFGRPQAGGGGFVES
jgi:hypothetical protein